MLTVGWKRRTWTVAAACERCSDLICGGVTALYDDADPPRHALCDDCFVTVRSALRPP